MTVSRYDAIVIGAGLGGLSAANNLARHGLGVLLLERHNVPGGYATSFVRGRFELEVSLHELAGIGRPGRRGSTYEYLEELGVAPRLDFVFLPHLYRTVAPGLDVTVPAGREAYVEALIRAFPREAAGIRRFVARCFDLWGDLQRLLAAGGKVGNPLLAPLRYRHLLRYIPVTLASVLERDVNDPAARAVLGQYWSYIGTPPSRAPFFNYAIMLASYLETSPAYPAGRSQALSHAFVESLGAHGGELRLSCGVRKILVEGGRAVGVITDADEEIRARWVVSNADPITTCRGLVGDEHLPSRFFDELRTKSLSPSTVNVYLGLDRTVEQVGLEDHEIFVNDDLDLDGHAAAMDRVGPPSEIAVTSYNVVYPDISQPGTSVVVLTTLARGAPWVQVPARDYLAAKSAVAEAMLRRAERVAPRLREAVEVIEVSTPLTNLRYAGTPGGAIYGFEATTWHNMALIPDHRGPVEGLMLTGAWTRPGGGYGPAISSGRVATQPILDELNPRANHAA